MKNNKSNNNKNIITFSIMILVIIIIISIGFSAFNSTVSTKNITAKIRPDIDVRITSFSVNGTSNGGTASNVDYDVRSVLTNLYLPNNNSTVTFTVSVKNYGNVEMGIPSICNYQHVWTNANKWNV